MSGLTLERIIVTVSQFTGIPVSLMRSARRDQRTVRARWIAAYLCRDFTSASLPMIGRALGNRDHTTIMHALRCIGERRGRDRELDAAISALTLELAMHIGVADG